MTKTMHACVSLDYLEYNHLQGLLFTGGEGRLSMRQSLEAIARFRAKGYTYWPACDNVDATGHCAGHEKEAQP